MDNGSVLGIYNYAVMDDRNQILLAVAGYVRYFQLSGLNLVLAAAVSLAKGLSPVSIS